MSVGDDDMMVGFVVAIAFGTILSIGLFTILLRCCFVYHRRNNLLSNNIEANLTFVNRNMSSLSNRPFTICNTSQSSLSDESIRHLSNNGQDSGIQINVNEDLRSLPLQRTTSHAMQREQMNHLAHERDQAPPAANSLERKYTYDPSRIRRSGERIQTTSVVLRVNRLTAPASNTYSLLSTPYYYEESSPPYEFEPTPPPSYDVAVAESSNTNNRTNGKQTL